MLEHVVQALDRAVFVHDQVRVIALRAVGIDHLREHLATCAVHRFHGRLVAVPGHVNLVEAHALDDAGVIRGKERVDLHTGLFGHVVQNRLP